MKDKNEKSRPDGYKHRQIILKMNAKDGLQSKEYKKMKNEGLFDLDDEKVNGN